MGIWLPTISSRIGERSYGRVGRRVVLMVGGRMNVHLAEDGTVRHVDFK